MLESTGPSSSPWSLLWDYIIFAFLILPVRQSLIHSSDPFSEEVG